MRLVRLAMCVAAFAVVGKIALSEDIDVRSLQQKLAAQEARLNDLQAKVNAGAYASGSEVEGILSANKNAVLTIGGTVNTRYFYRNGKVSDGPVNVEYNPDANEPVASTDRPFIGQSDNDALNGINDVTFYKGRASQGDLKVSDAKLTVNIDVNDYFDAFLKIDLQSSSNAASDNAEVYWVRWKNVCNSGFGLKVGRDGLVFGEGTPIGVLGTYAAGGGDGLSDIGWINAIDDEDDSWNLYNNLSTPLHNNWDEGRYVQINPYWESQNGKFGIEAALYQDWGWHERSNGLTGDDIYYGGSKWKSKNYGTSASLRLRARPVEGLLLSASVANFQNNDYGSYGRQWILTGAGVNQEYEEAGGKFGAKNNTAIDLAFSYRPAFFNKLNIWGQWIRGWNVNNIKDLDSDAVNLGFSVDVNESWTIFAQGDYLSSRGYQKPFGAAYNGTVGEDVPFSNADETGWGNTPYLGYNKAVAWSSYIGVKYTLPYGVNAEIGWKHEEIKWKDGAYYNRPIAGALVKNKIKTTKVRGDTIYAHLGFDF